MTWLQARDVGVLKLTGPGNPIQVTRSDDGGASWEEPVRVSSPDRLRAIAPAPEVDRDGNLYVLYLDIGGDRLDYEGGHRGRGGPPYPGPSELVLARSSDRGKTWEESVAGRGLVPTKRFLVFLPEFPSVAVARDGRVYAAYHSAGQGDPADVLLWTLAPGASTWSSPSARQRHPTTRRHGAILAKARGGPRRPARRPVLRPARRPPQPAQPRRRCSPRSTVGRRSPAPYGFQVAHPTRASASEPRRACRTSAAGWV